MRIELKWKEVEVEGVVEIVEEVTVNTLEIDEGDIVVVEINKVDGHVVVDDDEVVKEVLIHNSFIQ